MKKLLERILKFPFKFEDSMMQPDRYLEIQAVGGLGNQLFGLAAGLTLAGSLSRHPLINLERVGFGSNLSRVPELQNIDFGVLESDINFSNSKQSRMKFMYERAHRSSRNLLPPIVKYSEPEYVDSLESPQEQIKKFPLDTKSIGGPFMDFEWAELAKNIGFPSELQPKSLVQHYLDACKNASRANVAIHIRLGDYLIHQDIFPITPEDYYFDALESLSCKSKAIIHIFTDSPKLAKERYPKLFKLPEIQIIDSERKLSSLETMSVMSRYPNLVTSNSTFSSWAGWFNSNKNVVTPIPHLYNDWRDTLPKQWVRIHIK